MLRDEVDSIGLLAIGNIEGLVCDDAADGADEKDEKEGNNGCGGPRELLEDILRNKIATKYQFIRSQNFSPKDWRIILLKSDATSRFFCTAVRNVRSVNE